MEEARLRELALSYAGSLLVNIRRMVREGHCAKIISSFGDGTQNAGGEALRAEGGNRKVYSQQKCRARSSHLFQDESEHDQGGLEMTCEEFVSRQVSLAGVKEASDEGQSLPMPRKAW